MTYKQAIKEAAGGKLVRLPEWDDKVMFYSHPAVQEVTEALVKYDNYQGVGACCLYMAKSNRVVVGYKPYKKARDSVNWEVIE